MGQVIKWSVFTTNEGCFIIYRPISPLSHFLMSKLRCIDIIMHCFLDFDVSSSTAYNNQLLLCNQVFHLRLLSIWSMSDISIANLKWPVSLATARPCATNHWQPVIQWGDIAEKCKQLACVYCVILKLKTNSLKSSADPQYNVFSSF